MANTLIFEEISITRLQKGWTRHGGVNNGYHITEDRKEWNCQACGNEQPASITAYLFPFLESEILRICPPCQFLVNAENISTFTVLRKLVRG